MTNRSGNVLTEAHDAGRRTKIEFWIEKMRIN